MRTSLPELMKGGAVTTASRQSAKVSVDHDARERAAIPAHKDEELGGPCLARRERGTHQGTLSRSVLRPQPHETSFVPCSRAGPRNGAATLI